MTIFDILNDIFRNKTGELLNNNEFYEVLQSPYILQRWVSMDSTQNAYLTSETTNKLCKALADDKEMWYKLFLVLVDKKNGYKKIRYLKREKRTVNEEKDKIIEELSKRYEISKREVELKMNTLEEIGRGE